MYCFMYVRICSCIDLLAEASTRIASCIFLCVAHSDNMRNLVEFLMEAVLMADFDHRNVMWLIAIMIDGDMKPHVLLPLMEHGDLRSFIAKPSNV